MIIINFKNYKTGDEVLKLAKKIEKYLPKAIVAVPSLNIKEISEKTKLKVYAQHISYDRSKKSTGYLIPKAIKSYGATGTLLNHSEHKIKLDEIKKTMKECKKQKLKVVLCAGSLIEAKKVKKLKPIAIAFEDPKLIGTGKSITKYNSKGIIDFVKILKGTKIIPLCGAGINSKEDIIEAKKLGCKGVLIASAIANSKNPEKFLKEVS